MLRPLLRTLNETDPIASRTDVANPKGRDPTVTMGQAAERTGEGERLVAEVTRLDAASRYAEAMALLDTSLAVSPDEVELLSLRASILYHWGRFKEALDGFLRVASYAREHFHLSLQLGWLHSRFGMLAEAEGWMRLAGATAGASSETQYGLALVLMQQKRLDEAVAACEAAIKQRPEDIQCLFCLGQCKLRQDDPIGAEAAFRHALAIETKHPFVWACLGVSLRLQNRHRDALLAFERAEQLTLQAGEEADSFVDIATEYPFVGRSKEALDLLRKNLGRRPAVEGYRGYGELLLAQGQLKEGWHHYESRWLLAPLVSARFHSLRPVWNGQDLRGRTILLRFEQGVGDVVQFLRYAPYVKALGATVLVGKFDELAHGFEGIDRVIGDDTPAAAYDYYIHLLSLPRIFGTEVDTIPAAVPYLHAEPGRVARWGERLAGAGLRQVGLVWAGNPAHARDRYRSLTLDALTPLWDVPGVRFVLLQKGVAAEQAQRLPVGVEVVNLGPELEDFSDTAAVISQLDLVICVDTAVAHLAGALGKPVWVLLPQPADWRWMEEREDSPWYPTMRLFRQRQRGEWDEVIARVKGALQERVQERATGVWGGDEFPPKVPSGPLLPVVTLPRQAAGHRPGFSAVAECRHGILQYLPDEALVGDSIGWYGEYLQVQMDLLARLIRSGVTVLEVEAGVGAHSLALAAMLGPQGHLFLYESRAVVRRILQQNLAANRITNVTLMRRALGGTAEAVADAGSPADGNASMTVTETVDELQLERLDWFKINDGSSALDLLAGAVQTLWRLRPLLFIAVADAAMLAALATRAKEFGYRCWRMETAYFNPQNFNRRDSDIFSGRMALALLAIPEEIEANITLDQCSEIA